MRARVLMVDVDGVLVRHPDPRGWSAGLERDLGVSRDALQEAFFKQHWEDVVHGRAALRDRLQPVLAEIAPRVSADKLVRYWFENDAHIDNHLLEQLAGLRALGLEVHLATVQEHERAAYLWEDLGFSRLFNDIHYAAALGCSKPSAAFYEAVEARTGFRAADILFIDDSPRNVEAASARGWRAELWRPGAALESLIPELA